MMDAIELKILTEDNGISQLCRLYWQVEASGEFTYSVSAVAKNFGIASSKTSKLVEQSCHALSSKFKCARCGTSYIYPNRTDYQAHSRLLSAPPWFCKTCLAEAQRQKQMELQAGQERQRAILRETFPIAKLPFVHPSNISFEDAVYYISLIRLGASEDFSYIKPISQFPTALSPSEEFDHEIVLSLHRHGLIGIHPESDLTSFVFNEGEVRFYHRLVYWVPLVSSDKGAVKHTVEHLESVFMTGRWPKEWESKFYELGKKLALDECVQYLVFSL